jgi:glycosyltransferase involved in cell wall biosynthesis
MKLLLLQNAIYCHSYGGSNKGNRLLLESLASLGHQFRVIARATSHREPINLEHTLRARGIPSEPIGDAIAFIFNGVAVYAALSLNDLGARVVEIVDDFKPDWILVSSEDFGQQFVKAALLIDRSRVILLTHSSHDLPFGPSSFLPSTFGQSLIDKVRTIVSVAPSVQKYIKTFSGRDSFLVKLPFWGPGPFPTFCSFTKGHVAMITPCAIKGISIFVEMARVFSSVPFAAVPTWGTTGADIACLRKVPNITIIEPCELVDELYSRVKVLLVPSLWDENLGLVTIEAMLRGIPVIASDVGGLRESKLGVDFCIPVRPIQRYLPCFDQRMVPGAVIPPQDLRPWIEALRSLLTDEPLYERVSSESKSASRAHVAQSGAENFETFVDSLSRSPS